MMLATYASADEYLDKLPRLLRLWRGPAYLDVIPSNWTWRKSCMFRPRNLLNATKAYGGIIVSLDADAEIKTTFSEVDAIAALGRQTWAARRDPCHADRLMSGTLIINASHRDATEWLLAWAKECAKNATAPGADDAALGVVSKDYQPSELGPEWCWLEPNGAELRGTPPDTVYVWHHQCSRQMARRKGGR